MIEAAQAGQGILLVWHPCQNGAIAIDRRVVAVEKVLVERGEAQVNLGELALIFAQLRSCSRSWRSSTRSEACTKTSPTFCSPARS